MSMLQRGLKIILCLIFFGGAGILVFAGWFRPVKQADKTLVYRSPQEGDGEFSTFTVLPIIKEVENGVEVYRIEQSNQSDGSVLRIKLRVADWRPLIIERLDQNQKDTGRIEYQNQSVSIFFPGEKINKTIKLSDNYFDCNSLFYFFGAYPFGTKRKINFNMVMDGQYGRPVGVFSMYVRETGKEEITVPAGKFDCYKLEMGVAGIAGLFASKYKYYFWYPVSEPRFLIKYLEPNRKGAHELAEIRE